MPFTLSHTAAIAPFSPLIRRGYLALSALAIGTMSPDFEYLWRLRPEWQWSHSPAGVFYFCLPAGLAVLAAWVFVVREPVRALLTLPSANLSLSPRWWLQAAVAIVVGAFTHIIWDGVTHGYDWAVALFPVLRSRVVLGSVAVPWFNVLQHLSTLVGGLVVLGWVAREVVRGKPQAIVLPWRLGVLGAIGALAVTLGLWNAMRSGVPAEYWTLQVWLGRAAVGGLLGLGIGLFVYGVFHRAVIPASELVESQ